MQFLVMCVAALVVLATQSPSASSFSVRSGVRTLQVSSAASGGPALEPFGALAFTGQATRFGLSGRYREIDDLGAGWFQWNADYGISSADEGLNSRGRWRMDASRRVHPLNSTEAKTVAITESYIARRGYLHLESYRRVLVEAFSRRRASHDDIVAVTPTGGRTALLWIARADHLIHRIDIQLAERTKTIRYGDYRVVDGVALPFAIAIDDGDEPDTGRIAVSSYHLLRSVNQAAFSPPAENLADARFKIGRFARVDLWADSATTGFVVVLVSINGREPVPFIVDTGGHDILTPRIAGDLGLTIVGDGASFGAGAGSTRTAFTRIRSVTLGNAEVLDQPFVILYQDLGSALDAHRHTVPIAGILGLEFFERFAVMLDFKKGYLELRPRFATFERGGAALPITFTSDEPLVNARINGIFGSFAVDTGNNVGLILYHRWLVESNVSGLNALRGNMDGNSVGGMVSFHHARVRSVILGTVNLFNVPVLISEAGTGSMSSRSEAGSVGVPNFVGLRVTFRYAAGMMNVAQ